MLVALNQTIRDCLIAEFDADELRCDSVCECGDADCVEHVLLPPALFDDLKDNGVDLLRTGTR